MEEFSSDIQRVLKQPAFSSEMNPSNLELLNSLSQVNQPLSSQLLNYLSVDNLLTHASTAQPHPLPPYSNEPIQFHFPENSTFDQTNGAGSQSYPVFVGDATTDGNLRMDKNNRSTGKKRKRKGEESLEKPKEVIHVRAKRGQATDSHSLAERVRRERINEKLKVLQDLVPGCYKTMGMAVMLDVIINYVQSLQNQIEFLSMKLSAASMFYDFNSPEAEAIENLQRTTTNNDAHEMERVARGGNGETMDPRLHSTWPF